MPLDRLKHIIKDAVGRLLSSALIRESFSTTIWNLLGKAVGFLIPLAIAAWYGVTAGTDAFFFSYGLVQFLCNIFGPVGRATLVPFISDIRNQEDEDVDRFVGRVFASITLVVLAVLAGFLGVLKLALPLVTDFGPDVLDLSYRLILETSPLVLLLTWTAIITGVMNAYRRFSLPAVSPAFRAVVALTLIFALKDRLGLHAVPLGYVAGELVRVVILFASMERLTSVGIGLRDIIPEWSGRVRSFLGVAFFQNIGLLAMSLNPVVDRTMASWLESGSVSVLYYADRLYFIPVSLMFTGVMVVVRAHWSDDHYSGSGALRDNLTMGVKFGTAVTAPIALVLILVSAPVTALLLGRGEFPADRLPAVSFTWQLYLAGLVPHVLRLLYAQAFIILKDTRTNMMAALCVNVFNIAFNYAFMWRFGAPGIALSTTLSNVVALLFLRWRLSRKEI